jgi:Spy/CpxP family protein refolding chaperone
MDDFAGLNFTDDQKARINKIHEDFKARMDAVIKDEKLSADQKGAMLQGFQHMQRGEVYKVLTPDQQTEVRKRILARRTEAKKEQDKTKQPTPAPQVSPTPQPAQKPQSSKPPQPPAA